MDTLWRDVDQRDPEATPMSRTKKRGRGRPSEAPKLKVIWDYVPGPESEERLAEALRMLFAEKTEPPEPKSRQLKLY